MFDTHYDLLTIAYRSYINNDYSYLDKVSKYFNNNNVSGVIANLYFMSKEEMIDELGPNYYQDNISVLDMFKKSKEILDVYLPDTKIIYSIEGCDYISGCDELEDLYNAGLDSILLCWNNENRYGSGNKSDKGLTKDGYDLISKAIDLGMGIDLSHANKNTYDDIIKLVKDKRSSGCDVVCYASHSNIKNLCDISRNLDDEQINDLFKVGGLLGLLSNRSFVLKDELNKDLLNKSYMDHIEYASKILGFDNIMVSTDDMDFCEHIYGKKGIYEYSNVRNVLYKSLVDRFGLDNANKIIYDNTKNKIYDKIKMNREKKRGIIK